MPCAETTRLGGTSNWGEQAQVYITHVLWRRRGTFRRWLAALAITDTNPQGGRGTSIEEEPGSSWNDFINNIFFFLGRCRMRGSCSRSKARRRFFGETSVIRRPTWWQPPHPTRRSRNCGSIGQNPFPPGGRPMRSSLPTNRPRVGGQLWVHRRARPAQPASRAALTGAAAADRQN